MARYIDMTEAQRIKVWSREAAARKASAAAYIADAERDVRLALRRWAQNPESTIRQTSLRDADARLAALKTEFEVAA